MTPKVRCLDKRLHLPLVAALPFILPVFCLSFSLRVRRNVLPLLLLSVAVKGVRVL